MPAPQAKRREPAPGIFRLTLPLPFPGLSIVNAYLLRDEGDVTLVDCGIYDPHDGNDHGWDDLVAALHACDTAVTDIERLVVTHPHIDHYGMAGRLVEEAGCALWMHESSHDDLELYRDPQGRAEALRHLLADHGVDQKEVEELSQFEDWRAFVSKLVEPTHEVKDGDTLEAGGRKWEMLHTPGHSPAHICLWSAPDRILISGDHLLGSITPHIDYKRSGDEDPLGDFLASLARIEQLDPALVLPGHGRPFEEGAERARVNARHHDRRLGAILQVVRREAHTADEITDEIFGETLLNFERRLAIGEALAHIAYLLKRGEIEAIRTDDGTLAYKKVARQRGAE